jgi:uncharacterized membrane protein
VDNSVVLIVLRLIHILGGVFWAGTTFFYDGFLSPAVIASGPDGGRVISRLMTTTRFQTVMGLAAPLTQLSGILLFWRDARIDGWLGSGPGIGFSIGALAGLLTLIPFFTMFRPATARVQELSQRMAAAGGPPDPALLAELRAAQERGLQGGRISLVLLVISTTFMAIASYLGQSLVS